MVVRVAVLEGVTELRADLRRFAPDLSKDVQRVLSSEVRKLAGEGRALIPTGPPLSGMGRTWEQGRLLPWDGAAARAGLRGSTARGTGRGGGFTAVATLNQHHPAGALFETAGRRSTGALQTRLTGRFGAASRAGWRAVDRGAGRATAAIKRAVDAAETELNRRLKSGEL